jgi:hypothetical protein
VHVHAQCVVHAHAHFTLTTSNKNQSRHAHFSHDMHIFYMHISLCPGVGISVGYYRRPKIVSKRETGFCFLYSRPHHGHNSLINPPYQIASPKVSQFLSDLGRSSGKIYLPPLTNVIITCESPSLHRLSLKIDHRTKSTSILFVCTLVHFGLGK